MRYILTLEPLHVACSSPISEQIAAGDFEARYERDMKSWISLLGDVRGPRRQHLQAYAALAEDAAHIASRVGETAVAFGMKGNSISLDNEDLFPHFHFIILALFLL